jgi:hypothetical protein
MKTRLEWEAHLYEYKERSADWYWAVAIVTGALAATSIILGNIILGILIVVGSFTLTLFVNREPDVIDVSIDERGVRKGDIFYPYEALRSFWIDHTHSHPRFYLRSAKVYVPLIIIPLGDADVEEVADLLDNNLEEEHHAPPFVERLLEALGF